MAFSCTISHCVTNAFYSIVSRCTTNFARATKSYNIANIAQYCTCQESNLLFCSSLLLSWSTSDVSQLKFLCYSICISSDGADVLRQLQDLLTVPGVLRRFDTTRCTLLLHPDFRMWCGTGPVSKSECVECLAKPYMISFTTVAACCHLRCLSWMLAVKQAPGMGEIIETLHGAEGAARGFELTMGILKVRDLKHKRTIVFTLKSTECSMPFWSVRCLTHPYHIITHHGMSRTPVAVVHTGSEIPCF